MEARDAATREFAGKVIVVTGAASGIGLCTARLFASAGATVEAWDLRAPGEEVATDGETLHFAQVDVSRAEEVARAAEEVVRRHGRVDVLINNAGLNIGEQRAALLTETTLERIVSINLVGTVNCVRACTAALVASKRGVVVNTASILASTPLAGTGAYAASKAAVVALTKAWARELGPAGVRVNAVAPGFIDTRMNEQIPPQLRTVIVNRTPLGRIGNAVEVAAVHRFLASDAASFITGAVIAIDGGLTL